MAKGTLLTNYVDDILNASMNGKRKYNLIQNDDGTVSLEDVTTYDQIGSDFSSAIVNAICKAVNESADKNKILETLDEVVATTEKGYIPDALALKEVNNSLNTNRVKIKQLSKTIDINANSVANFTFDFSDIEINQIYGFIPISGGGQPLICSFSSMSTSGVTVFVRNPTDAGMTGRTILGYLFYK